MNGTPKPQSAFLEAWEHSLAWLNAGSDVVVIAVYFFIAGALLLVARRRMDLVQYRWILRLSSWFTLLLGLSYLLSVAAQGPLASPLVAVAKALAAVTAVVSAAMLWRISPGLMEPEPVRPPPDEPDPEFSIMLEKQKEKQKRTEDELRKLSSAVKFSSSMVVITDTSGRVEYCNPAFCKITGYAESEILGRRAAVLKSDKGDSASYTAMWETLRRGDPWEGEILERKKGGEVFWCLKYFAPIRDEAGQISHYVSVSHDVTALKTSEETIRRLAYYDPLTELPNRTLFKELLDKALSQAKREGTSCAVIALDLDRFKNVNDSLGEEAGDQLLVAVGQRLCGCLREGDVVARLGGDTFAMTVPGLRHAKMAGAAAATIKEAMNRPFLVAEKELFITASIGISVFPTDHPEINKLIKMAETAMYHAKESGRNLFLYYSEIPNAVTPEQLSLETSLRFAVEREELDVFYQPKFELESENCFTVEALVRWRHPVQGMISPGRFIPIAEETGLIAVIGEWVLRKVCWQIGQWKSEGIDLAVAVNLSARQFRQKNLLERIDSILTESGVDCSRLEFEITESAIMNNPEQTAEILRGMKERRLALSIDDFGTGYSSLAYLRLFPVDILKIDQSFVRDIGTASGDTRIVKAIIALAHSLDLTVVAEGVETAAQLEFLRKQRCDLVQGYYYSRPLPAAEMVEKLRSLGKANFQDRGRGSHFGPGVH